MNELNGQKILVTGASRGIGLAITRSLLQAGATVAVHYNTAKEEVRELEKEYSRASGFQADLEDPLQVTKLFRKVEKEFEQLDTLILNAGVFIPHQTDAPFDSWLQVWQKTMAINLDAVGILTRHGIEHFKEQEGGRFIFIGSRAAFRGETEEYLAYAASKGGLTSLSRTVARSFGKYNIKSFVIAPGFTRTEMAEKAIAQIGEKQVLETLALNKLTTPEDIAPLATFICSGQMDHATGVSIDVNAGSYIR